MTYKYSICHPDKSAIEYPDKELNTKEVFEMVKSYPWVNILEAMEKISNDKIFYSPSLDFKNLKEERSLTISGMLENGKLEFSVWYHRPVKYRPLYGLLPERTKIKLTDLWGLSLEKSLEFFSAFLDKKYEKLDSLMAKK